MRRRRGITISCLLAVPSALVPHEALNSVLRSTISGLNQTDMVHGRVVLTPTEYYCRIKFSTVLI